MNGFRYKVSVIVPVYNVEKYLGDCLDSLVAQTIDRSQMEVLLINDGSTDGSLDICKDYEDIFDCFKIFSQENAGVSAARNFGIDNASGKYIMFLDSDDSLAPDTLKSVTDYFDTVYDLTDVVTYPESKYENGIKQPAHFRYNYFKETGIYDINDSIYLTVSRVNIAIKNRPGENLHFDTELKYAEDQQYIYGLLKEKMNVGFINDGLYQYNLRGDSVIGSSGYAYYFWESVVTDYYEKLFDSYSDNGKKVPKYLQAMFLYDSNWKIRKDQFLPYHYEKSEFDKAINRLKGILKRVDDDVLLDHPALDFYHKFYLLKFKNAPVTFLSDNKKYRVILNGKVIKEDTEFEIIVVKFRIKNGRVRMLGHLKSVVYDFIEKPVLYACVNGRQESVELFESTQSRYKSKIKTNKFWGFYFDASLDGLKTLSFNLSIDMRTYPTRFFFMPTAPFNKKLKDCGYYNEGKSVAFDGKRFVFSDITEEKQKELLLSAAENICNKDDEIYQYRISAIYPSKQKIWLYYDCGGVDRDNGYYQFIHDFDKTDGIRRYYINNNGTTKPGLFEEKHLKNIIRFGSKTHKNLFIHCDKIITAFAERDNIFPFSRDYDGMYTDILNFDVVYLQHGILHASIPWKYTPESLRIDKIVVSSEFEAENFHEKYNFAKNDIITTGMPRFLHIDRNEQPERRILFAPSWRNYLITPQVNNYWAPTVEKFMGSDYFKLFNQFLTSYKLNDYLKSHDLHMDFKLHPIFYEAYKKCFDLNNETVSFADNSVKDENYIAFITDFSSFVFDFAYLKRPIMYFVPDYVQFKSGMNQYRELDLPFEKAFGKLVTDPDAAVDELIRIAENNFVPDTVYSERMSSFFLPMDDCEEKLYRYLIKEN